MPIEHVSSSPFFDHLKLIMEAGGKTEITWNSGATENALTGLILSVAPDFITVGSEVVREVSTIGDAGIATRATETLQVETAVPIKCITSVSRVLNSVIS